MKKRVGLERRSTFSSLRKRVMSVTAPLEKTKTESPTVSTMKNVVSPSSIDRDRARLCSVAYMFFAPRMAVFPCARLNPATVRLTRIAPIITTTISSIREKPARLGRMMVDVYGKRQDLRVQEPCQMFA